MQRRKFLKLTGLSAVALAIPGVGMGAISTEQAIAGILKNEFDYLELDDKGLKQFVKDFLEFRGHGKYVHVKVRTLYLFRVKAAESSLVDRLAREYILATDFFINKMDESKTVKYIGLYDPYKRPCANPFTYNYYQHLNT
ncbi:hypothetical protein D770_26770 [Flammeovirgaceae bacterium 311]|nr:hypothetical protein D770_26770 [Flammeovirgaceae bacterium 311]